jgi:sortase (surface protein transpeptidase)
MSQTVTDRSIQLTLDNFPKRIVCYWYNIPSDYGEITIYKWTCPAGYDLSAWGADPKVDCTQATNGVTFTLTPPAGPALQTDTGDSIDGAVYFGGLDPGAYNVTETVPANTAYVFVLDCTGTDIPKVHQYPLSWGNKLDVNVAGGDQIVCHWYNVPKPEKGWVTVTKYVCSTKTFVDKVYCTIYEKGQSIELTQVTGKVSKGVGITNTGGTYTWKDLDPGAYTVTEQGMVPCKMTASMVDGKGNAQVVAGKGTMVNVYNCTSTPGKVPPGKVPTKYPNTGVPPEGVDNLMPAMQGEQVTEPAGTPSPEEEAFYQVDCVSGSVDAGTPAPSTPAPDATMPPIEAEPTEAPVDAATTPTPPATPEVGEGECARGAIPTHLSVESIGVDADFEYKEIVDGLMDQPTGPEDVAWYKDTARLGENNNVVVAGHLNWWNVPEGVFYRLQDMQEGDRIEVTGDDGQVYIYEVRSVTQESNLEEPGVEVIGPTDEPTLTLITCGGEWNADIAEYDERTVVRAVQVDVQPADTAAGG